MTIALWVVLGLFGILLVSLAAIISLPVKLRFLAQTGPHPDFRLEVSLLGGITPALPITDGERTKKKPKKQKPKKEKKKSGGPNTDRVMRMIKAAPDLVIDLLRQFHFEHLSVQGVFGLGDPAETGQLYGRLMPFIYGPCFSEKISIAIRPDFEKAHLSGAADAVISVTPATLFPPAIQFTWRSFGPRS